jgi:hypothetical protein
MKHGPNDTTPLRLVGEDGNAVFIIGKALRAARGAGWTKEQQEALKKDFTSGDYDHVLQVAMDNFDVE